MLSHCTGAFVLAAAGLLDGRRATTHWRWAAELASRYPSIDVPDTGIDQVAAQCGLTPLMLRRHFARRFGITPQAYRRTFGQAS